MEELNKLVKQQEQYGMDINAIIEGTKAIGRTRNQYQTSKATLNEIWIKVLTNHDLCQSYNLPDHTYIKTNYFAQIKSRYEEAIKRLNNLPVEDSTNIPSVIRNVNNTDVRVRRFQIRCNALREEMSLPTAALAMENININHWKSRLNSLWVKIEELHFEILEDLILADSYQPGTYSQLKTDYYTIINGLDDKHEQMQKALINSGNMKLPKVTIPTFEGGFPNWAEFHDLFLRVIHENNTLSNVEKLQLLKQYTKSEAAKLLQHLSLTGDNYASAWDILKERYNHKRLILSKLIDRILDQTSCSVESAVQLRQLHDTTNEGLLAIKNLGFNAEDWGPAIIGRIIAI